MKDLSIQDYPTYEKNPFLEDVYESEVIKKRDGSKLVATSVSVTNSEGQTLGPAYIKKTVSKYIDSREFIRITNEGIDMMATLKLVEYRIFSFVLMQLKYNELYIKLMIEDIKKLYHYKSRNPIYQGITGLLQKGVISRITSKKSEYFINPLYFYKGTIVKDVFGYVNNSDIQHFSTPEG